MAMLVKMKELLGFDNFEEEYEDDVEVIGEDSRMDLEHTRHEDYSYDIKQELKKLEEEKNKEEHSANLINIHNSDSKMKIKIAKPSSYEDAAEICDALKNKQIVLINTKSLSTKIAQRLIDFVSGTCYALEGDFQEIEKGVFVVTPLNVESREEEKPQKQDLGITGILSWTN